MKKGSFTLPGEAGYEKLTLEMAKKWGADVIRDSDGTKLSDEITNAGYGIYSTICIIREHNDWAKANTDKLQQTFLCTEPRVAATGILEIGLMDDFFKDQFRINDSKRAMKYWEVYDRTENVKVDAEKITYDKEGGKVILKGITPWHKYTVSFLAYRIWEEISMYNHTTNHWDKEHLMQIDPMYPETREYLLKWMTDWCETHPTTTVVRFTSMFYNFVWIWGSNERCRHLYSDWASYDFTVSDLALDLFEQKYGYRMTAEDFINQGKLHVTHTPGNKRKSDWMEFIHDFVISFGKELIDIVHKYNKKAYVFYDDSWVGVEPYSDRFTEFGFDGIIKCVFSGFEVRLCAGVKAETHELRLHPYLFPVGLGGLPTFMEGGDPARDAKEYWVSVRRALLRDKIDRIGLGGYLHLTEGFPDFNDTIESIADEFRTIKELHNGGKPYTMRKRIGVLHYWGKLRSWTLSGHFHETFKNDLIHINEALSGMPADVFFLSFEDIKKGALRNVDILINAGVEGSAWSGGESWNDPELVARITEWVYNGGSFIGVNEPSAVQGNDTVFKLSHILGVDEDSIDRICHGRYSFEIDKEESRLIPEGAYIKKSAAVHITDPSVRVLLADGDTPLLTRHTFGRGEGIYLSSFEKGPENNFMLLKLLLSLDKRERPLYTTNNPYTECAYYPKSKTLVVINNSSVPQNCIVFEDNGGKAVSLEPYETKIITNGI